MAELEMGETNKPKQNKKDENEKKKNQQRTLKHSVALLQQGIMHTLNVFPSLRRWWCADRTYRETGILCAFHSLSCQFLHTVTSHTENVLQCAMLNAQANRFFSLVLSNHSFRNFSSLLGQMFYVQPHHRSSRIKHAQQVVPWSGILSCSFAAFLSRFVHFLFHLFH